MTSKKIKIFLPIEISSRELLYKVYLSNHLATLGFECYLGTKANIAWLIERSRGFIYFDKGFHKGVSETLYSKIKENNGLIVSLDEEGAIDFKDGSVLGVRYDLELFKVATTVFFWGTVQYENSNFLNLEVSNRTISGHPRFQLLKKEYQFLYEKETNIIRKKFGKFVLINTNMGFGNNLRGEQFVRRNYGNRFKNLDGIIENDKMKMRHIVSLCKRFSQVNVKVILRPHPEEDVNYYTDNFVGIDNIVITKDYSAVSWILASEHMIHIDCTTGVEALMLGRKSVAYVPEELDKSLLTCLPLSLSYVISDESEVVKHCLRSDFIDAQDSIFEDNILSQYFSFRTDSFAVISAKLQDIRTMLLPGVNSISRLTIFMRAFKMFSRNILLGKDQLISQKQKGFEWKEISDLHLRIKSSKKEFFFNKCRRLIEGLYVIRN